MEGGNVEFGGWGCLELEGSGLGGGSHLALGKREFMYFCSPVLIRFVILKAALYGHICLVSFLPFLSQVECLEFSNLTSLLIDLPFKFFDMSLTEDSLVQRSGLEPIRVLPHILNFPFLSGNFFRRKSITFTFDRLF